MRYVARRARGLQARRIECLPPRGPFRRGSRALEHRARPHSDPRLVPVLGRLKEAELQQRGGELWAEATYRFQQGLLLELGQGLFEQLGRAIELVARQFDSLEEVSHTDRDDLRSGGIEPGRSCLFEGHEDCIATLGMRSTTKQQGFEALPVPALEVHGCRQSPQQSNHPTAADVFKNKVDRWHVLAEERSELLLTANELPRGLEVCSTQRVELSRSRPVGHERFGTMCRASTQLR